MNGTEKQITWAMSIIETNLKELQEEVTTFEERSAREKVDYTEVIGKLKKAINDLNNSNYDASWWIDHRGVAKSFIQRIKR